LQSVEPAAGNEADGTSLGDELEREPNCVWRRRVATAVLGVLGSGGGGWGCSGRYCAQAGVWFGVVSGDEFAGGRLELLVQ